MCFTCTNSHFETEAKDNPEMAYFHSALLFPTQHIFGKEDVLEVYLHKKMFEDQGFKNYELGM